jgi:LL-diaminopimelate aminotransferase
VDGKKIRRYVDPDTQVTSTIGSKEAVWHLPFAYINQGEGEKVLMPSIGYPPYKSGTIFAGGKPVFYDLKEENGFLPDLNEIGNELKEGDVKIMWINYPHNPTTVKAPEGLLRDMVRLAQKYNVILASDEAYSEMYPVGSERPLSVLQVAGNDWENLVVFQSLSKRSNATGLRIGFGVGDINVINNYKKINTQIHTGTANAIQEAAIAGWGDEEHVEEMRKSYDRKRTVMKQALASSGLKEPYADATFYIWQPVPEGISSADLSASMLQLSDEERIGINAAPGSSVALSGKIDGRLPGDGYVRFALVPSEEDTERAAEAIGKHLPRILNDLSD